MSEHGQNLFSLWTLLCTSEEPSRDIRYVSSTASIGVFHIIPVLSQSINWLWECWLASSLLHLNKDATFSLLKWTSFCLLKTIQNYCSHCRHCVAAIQYVLKVTKMRLVWSTIKVKCLLNLKLLCSYRFFDKPTNFLMK